jgi:hypothetical protein
MLTRHVVHRISEARLNHPLLPRLNRHHEAEALL